MPSTVFTTNCQRCERLAQFLVDVKAEHPDYFAKPVPPFGDPKARLLIVGLAPGKHGANATGRPFTGDYAGVLLYETLHEYGFSNQPVSTDVNDGLKLINCRITNAVKCLPPENKPTTSEINTCNDFLAQELLALKPGSVILALGGIAHKAVIKSFGLRQAAFTFGHGALHELQTEQGKSYQLLDSYHCSRYNTQTKRLTPTMFKAIFKQAQTLLNSA